MKLINHYYKRVEKTKDSQNTESTINFNHIILFLEVQNFVMTKSSWSDQLPFANNSIKCLTECNLQHLTYDIKMFRHTDEKLLF